MKSYRDITKGRGYKFIFNFHKTCFETGGSICKYLLYLIALFGMASQNLSTTMYLAVGYGLLSYLVGYGWFMFDWYEAQLEVSFVFNRFVREMRKSHKKRKI